jgi:AraC family transcriptional regulator, transcriptional activator FtrA
MIASMRVNPAKGQTVAIAVAPGVSTFELGIACEVFGIDRSELGVPWYRLRVCAEKPGAMATASGFTINAPYGLDTLARADTIVVTPPGAGWEPSEALLRTLASAHRRGKRMISLCTGALVLAAAGVLDGRSATTHWMHAEELATRYPRVNVDPAVLYVDDDTILTSAGSAAAIDLCLHVVALDFGSDIANAVARRMVITPHRDGGQAQFIESPLTEIDSEDRFSDALDWAQVNLHDSITVEMLAHRAAMSPRSFARRFRATTGTAPYRWVLRQRVLLAQRLLETTDLTVDVIADQCGLAPPALRDQFQRIVGTSPSRYRTSFRRASA